MKKILSFQFSLALLTCLLFSSSLFAEGEIIKYGKYLIYEGEVANKLPNGKGTLKLLDPKNKKVSFCEISGEFADTLLTTVFDPLRSLTDDVAATFSSGNFADFTVSGSVALRYYGEKKKCESFDAVIKNAAIRGNITARQDGGGEKTLSEIFIEKLTLSFTLTKNGWDVEVKDQSQKSAYETFFYKEDKPYSGMEGLKSSFTGEVSGLYLPSSTLDKFKYGTKRTLAKFFIGKNDFFTVGPLIYIADDGTALSENTFYNPKRNYKLFLYTDDWRGDRVLNDGTKVSKTLGVKDCVYIFPDGSRYKGTLKGQGTSNTFFPLYSDAEINVSSFYDGEYTKDGKTERWIKGESQSALHQRIVSLYDEDLVAQIESGSISENDAAQTQRDRNRQRNEAKFGTPEEANTQITNQTYVHLITDAGIPHRNYEGKIIVSSFEEIVKLLNNDVVGYYDILAKDKQLYLPRLQKEKKYLMEDEFQREIPYNSGDNTDSDIWWPKYDQSKHCFTFRMWHHDAERYALSNEKGAFHLLVGCREANYCFTYPKSLVSVVNEKHRDGNRIQMQQDQTVYTCTVPDGEATIFSYNKNGSFLWQFKIEKVQANKKRIYGKTTKLQVVSGGRVLADISRTLTEKGNKFNQTDTKEYSVSPPQWHICSSCNGKGWGTGLNDNRRKVCPNCHGKGKVYF